MTHLTASLRRRGVIAYILLAFSLTWVAWEIPIRLGSSPGDLVSFQLLALPGAMMPAVAAIIVRRWVTREGFGDSGLRPALRRSWRFYLAGWLLPLMVTGAIIGLAILLGIARPDWSLRSGFAELLPNAPQDLPSGLIIVLPFTLLLNALLFSPLLWGEEFGWRGYLQPRLFPGRPLASAIATGIIWSLWHLPLNLRGYNFPGSPVAGILVFTVSTVLLSIVFGWLTSNSRSIWPACLAHAASNSVGSSLTLLLFGRSRQLWTGYVGILAWAPLAVACAWILRQQSVRPPGGDRAAAEPL